MSRRTTIKSIQRMFFRTQIILIITLALFLGVAGTLVSIRAETSKRDRNLRNVAEAVARSPLLVEAVSGDAVSGDAESGADAQNAALAGYLDSLKESLSDIDVISVVGRDRVRLYHSNHSLIGTLYDGNLPALDATNGFYATDENGPSGRQRRAYAVIHDADGREAGVVMSIMLMENVHSETYQTLLVFAAITLAAVLVELIVCARMSGRIKRGLLGYEPDVFTSMFKTRDNILESLDEGIVAVDSEGRVQFANRAACRILGGARKGVDTGTSGEATAGSSAGSTAAASGNLPSGGLTGELLCDVAGGALGHSALADTLRDGEKRSGGHPDLGEGGTDILLDSIPVMDGETVAGAVGILRDRAEYTRLMEDLAGTRYLVDSMRANNHDFTNKLHVILGLIEMGMYDKATSYIQNITVLERSAISRIMNAVSDPAVAALLIGKTARASELNVRFTLREGCRYSPSDLRLPSGLLVTVIGNLLDNAFDAMNDRPDYDAPRELLFGIFSKPGALLITVDDTGGGIAPENLERIFESGYSTKGEGRGTGLYHVRQMVGQSGGSITVESQPGVGTCFTVSFTGKEDSNVQSSDS